MLLRLMSDDDDDNGDVLLSLIIASMHYILIVVSYVKSVKLQARSHVARLRLLWGGQNFKRTQLTVAITGVATVWRVGYNTILRADQAENFLVCTQLCHFGVTLVANEVNKNLSNKFVGGGQEGSLVGPPCLFLAT